MIDLRTHPKDQIELEHIETGERVPCEAGVYWPDEVGDYRLSGETPDEYRWFNADGTQIGCCCKWRIVAKRTEWWQRPELRERVVALVKAFATNRYTKDCDTGIEARALLAEIEPPKDALEEVITIVGERYADDWSDADAAKAIREELAKRGLAITELTKKGGAQ